jgi:hypothetical protein
MVLKEKKGFSYFVEQDHLERYQGWPVERKLKWLFYGNKLRKSLPAHIIARQEAFRKGKS